MTLMRTRPTLGLLFLATTALLAAALRRHARATLPAIGEALGVEVSRASILARRDGAEGASKEVRKKIAAFEKLLSERSA